MLTLFLQLFDFEIQLTEKWHRKKVVKWQETNICTVLGTVPVTQHPLPHQILAASLWYRYFYKMIKEDNLGNKKQTLFNTLWSGQSPFGELQNRAEGRKLS